MAGRKHPGGSGKDSGSFPSGNVTLRFDGDILEQLRNEADQKRISLNTLASQIFKSHTEFTGRAAGAGMIPVPKNLVMRLINRLSEHEIASLSEEIAKNEMKDMLLTMKRSYSPQAFVSLIESWIRASGFPFSHNESDGTHSFVVQHDMGKRWSSYLGSLFKYVFEDLGAKWVDVQTTDNTIAFNVDL